MPFTAARNIASSCISIISGNTVLRRQDCCPSAGLCSCNSLTLRMTRSSSSSSLWGSSCFCGSSACNHSRRFSNTPRSGSNSCSGESSKRIVTGNPSIASNSCSKSDCCIGNRRSNPLLRSDSLSARIIFCTKGSRAGDNSMCSVLHNPIPSAPSFRAVMASCGRSALESIVNSFTSLAHSSSSCRSDEEGEAELFSEAACSSFVPSWICVGRFPMLSSLPESV
ncbi:hypothetical protein D3C74_323710 [compost metagenome]